MPPDWSRRQSLATASSFVFGSGHSQLAALELSRRAGGLAPVQVIFDPTWGAAEQLEGYAEALLAEISLGAPDCLVVVSHSGAAGSDAAVRLADVDPGLGPTSTVVAVALLHEVVVSAVAGLVRRGLEPPVLRAHPDRGGHEHNAALLERYRGRSASPDA